MPGAFALDLLTDRVLDDVIDDIGGRVIDPPRLAHLRLFLDFGLVPRCQADDLAQEALVNRPQDLDRQDAEMIRAAVFEVEALQNRLDDLVIDLQAGGSAVGRLGNAVLFAEMKQAGVVFQVGLVAHLAHEPGVNAGLLAEFE